LFSTAFGVRGINLKKHYYIHVNKNDFSDKLNFYCKDLFSLKNRSVKAQNYVNSNYTWEVIVQKMVTEIETLIT